MTLLSRFAVGAVAFISMGVAVPAPQDGIGANRSGIERVQANPDSGDAEPRSNEGRAPDADAERQPPPGDDGLDGDSDSDTRAPAPADPPGCIFRDRPLDLIV